MKAYIINTETMEWPIYQGDFEVAHPDMNVNNPPAPFQWVYTSDQPEHNSITQGVQEVEPKQDETGKWYTQYRVYDYTASIVFDWFARNIQWKLDEFAKTRGYENITSLATYSTSTNSKFIIEGQYGVQVRDQMWATLYQILAEVETGTRPMPQSFEEIEQELPQLEWPNT